VSNSPTTIFEYRGRDMTHADGSPLTDDEKAEEVYEITLNADGTIATEEPAERVVTVGLTADDTWFGDAIVYVYGIDASTALDDLKLVVWGEERSAWKALPVPAQGHHNQNQENESGLGRWWITDEEPLNVLRMVWVNHEDQVVTAGSAIKGVMWRDVVMLGVFPLQLEKAGRLPDLEQGTGRIVRPRGAVGP
jgi:hypothetical protein